MDRFELTNEMQAKQAKIQCVAVQEMEAELERMRQDMEKQIAFKKAEMEKHGRRLVKENLLKIFIEQDSERSELNRGNVRTMFCSGIHIEQGTNSIICAPTQVGKTDAILQVCATSIENDIPVIITVDNSIAQCEQMHSRLILNAKTLFPDGIPKIIVIGDIKIPKLLKSLAKEKLFIFIALNNYTQVGNLGKIKEGLQHKTLTLIHDEADTITKADSVTNIEPTQPRVHQEWLQFIQGCIGVNVQRYFVTATPENCHFKYPVLCERVLPLLPPISYQGWKDLKFKAAEGDIGRRLFLISEVKRIKDSEDSGIILVISEKKIDEHHDKVDDFVTRYNVPVHSYNSDGIRVKFPEAQRELYNEFTKAIGIRGCWNNDGLFVVVDKKVSLADFYTIMDNIGVKCLITIGRNMLTRGLSCASKNSGLCLAAVSLLYTPGGDATMNGVGITQIIGRICGSVRPDLERRICTTTKVWNMYTGYCESQERYLEQFIGPNNGKLTSSIINSVPVVNFGRLERKILKCEYKNFEPPKYADVVEFNGQKIIKWIQSKTLVGRMIEYLHNTNEISVSEFKNGLGYTGSDESFESNLSNGRNPTSQYGKLWNYKSNIVSLTNELRKFLNEYKY